MVRVLAFTTWAGTPSGMSGLISPCLTSCNVWPHSAPTLKVSIWFSRLLLQNDFSFECHFVFCLNSPNVDGRLCHRSALGDLFLQAIAWRLGQGFDQENRRLTGFVTSNSSLVEFFDRFVV